MDANLYALFERHFADARSALRRRARAARSSSTASSTHCRRASRTRSSRAGCRPGDRVAVQVDKHWPVLPLYLASLRAGLVYLPLNTGYQRAELALFFGDAEPRVIVCGRERLGVVATLARAARRC